MGSESPLIRAYSVITLRQTRAQLRNWWGFLMVGSVGAVFALISMVVGQMLTLENVVGGNYYVTVLWANSATQWWNYPAVLAVQPWGVVTLPFLSTVAMALVSYGVGLGMSVAVLIGVRMLRARRRNLGKPTALGAATGLTPAMIALVTLGACCSTTAAATAGIGVAAQTSGTTINALLFNSWYLNIFQLVILWVALIAQEQLLLVYGAWFAADPSKAPTPARSSEPFALPKGLLRLALLIGGVTWSLASLASWTFLDPASPGPWMWAHWILQQQMPGLLAVVVALAPAGVAAWGVRHLARPEGWLMRGVLIVAGLSLVGWMPPALVSVGFVGWGNELLGSLGVGAAWGAASSAPFAGWGLVFHWALQLLLLGGFAIAVSVAPGRAIRILAASPTPMDADGSEHSSSQPSSGLTRATPSEIRPRRVKAP